MDVLTVFELGYVQTCGFVYGLLCIVYVLCVDLLPSTLESYYYPVVQIEQGMCFGDVIYIR